VFQHFPTVGVGQVHVEDHQFIGVLPGQVQAVDATGGAIDDIAAFGQALLQVIGGFLLVLNHKDTHGDLPSKETERGHGLIEALNLAVGKL